VIRSVLCLLAPAVLLTAQVPATLEYAGKPLGIVYECTSEDVSGAGLACSVDDPCPVFLELSGIETAGPRIVVSGNLHTATATLSSVLLTSEDGGRTWVEPYARIRFGLLEQIQFADLETGWIAGARMVGLPKDPFLLITTDGGKRWREQPLFEEPRAAAIERFWFDSRTAGVLLLKARTANRHELYETATGGESWSLRQASASPIRFPRPLRDPADAPLRIRADGRTHSFHIERQQAGKWTLVADFLVDIGQCKP
jgi:photosystem II stability/assembly factor-like uncharacterized protein